MDEAQLIGNAALVALSDDISPAEYHLGSEVCTIGRARGCRVLVPRDDISRLHARIEASGPRFILSDAGSVNGTYVNGRRITSPHMLADDDAIGLGSPMPLLRFLDPDATIQSGGKLRYDEKSMFWLNSRPLELTKTQFRLLLHLYRNFGSVCTRESCAEAIWNRDFDPGLDAGALDQAINSLRRVLREADPETDLIQTRRGVGYELVM